MEKLLLTLKEAAAILGMTEGALRERVRRGAGPPARKMSERTIVIRRDELREWLEHLDYVSTPCRGGPTDGLGSE